MSGNTSAFTKFPTSGEVDLLIREGNINGLSQLVAILSDSAAQGVTCSARVSTAIDLSTRISMALGNKNTAISSANSIGGGIQKLLDGDQ